MTRILVCGGRDFADIVLAAAELNRLHRERRFTLVIQGGARGADFIAKMWAVDNNVPVRQYDADWARDGRAAGPLRNQRMLDEGRPDLVVAFPGGRGTADMVRRTLTAGIKVMRVGLLSK